MNNYIIKRYLKDEIEAALALLPNDIAPDYPGTLDFSRLSAHISKLEQQHLVLSLCKWIECHAQWLEANGMLIERSWLPEGSDCGVMTLGHRNDRAQLFERAGIPSNRHAAVTDLVLRLNGAASVSQRPLIAELVCDLNAIRWNPQRAQCVLIETLDDIMENGQVWLDAHHTYDKGRSLHHATQPAHAQRNRGRL